jgi:hypothetical protein
MPEILEKPPQEKRQDKEEKSSWSEKISEIIIRAAFGGGLSAFVTLVSQSDLPRVALCTFLGGGIAPIVLAVGEPISKRLKLRGGQASEVAIDAFENSAQRMFAVVIGAETKYLEAQKLACRTDRCQGLMQSIVPLLDEIYVPLSIAEGEISPGWEQESGTILSNEFTIWQLLQQVEKTAIHNMAILAWGGYGKTTLLKHIAYIYSSGQHDRSDINVQPKIPVLLPLGECWRKYLAIKDSLPNLAITINEYHIPKLSTQLNMSPTWAEEQLKSGKMIVLLDGLDEVPKDQRPTVAQWIECQIGTYRNSIFIVTSRPKAYKEQAQADHLVLSKSLYVESFDSNRRRKFVEKWFLCRERYANNNRTETDVTQWAQGSAEELLAEIESNSDLQDLAKIPLLLNMIATFYRNSNKPKLPQRRVDLYQKICDLQLKDRPEAKKLDTLLINTDAQAILQMLALKMLLNNREQSCNRRTLLTLIQECLQLENETASPEVFLDDVVRISELLVEKDADSYAFAHLSFQEYLAARELWMREQGHLLYGKLHDAEWKPTILMYVAHLKNPNNFIREVLNQNAVDLAYACLQETHRKIDLVIQQQVQNTQYLNFGRSQGICGITTEIKEAVIIKRYSRLGELLKKGEWEAADKETYNLIITAVGKEEGQWFDREDLEKLPCLDLRAIDRLWVEASGGHFGFSVQKRVWEEYGSPKSSGYAWDRFCVEMGWKLSDGISYIDYSDLKKDIPFSPMGELPIYIRYLGLWDSDGEGRLGLILFSRANTCGL